MVFGSNKLMGAAQSLFLLKHDSIPQFCADYLALGDDRGHDRLPEWKFIEMERRNPERYGRHTIKGDRDRPIPWDEPEWRVQQVTESELQEIMA
jgi:hypothetical protein